ncbi:hypothetical protein GCM10010305_02060 [Streptomyces termitum]|uniref:Uncharacterized protein n=1 Tax=Streptomyces termitum TaxID=67368 RepID=A0A918SPM0_9ACTN|nr:hypothetical protein GCM10010305_02060 [Streptomyces termitum]
MRGGHLVGGDGLVGGGVEIATADVRDVPDPDAAERARRALTEAEAETEAGYGTATAVVTGAPGRGKYSASVARSR